MYHLKDEKFKSDIYGFVPGFQPMVLVHNLRCFGLEGGGELTHPPS
jgi:hypothetical protein